MMETDKNNSAGVEEKVQESSAVDKIQDSDIAEKVTDSNIADKVTDSDKSKEVNSEYADKGRDEVVESEKVKELTSNKHTAAEEEKRIVSVRQVSGFLRLLQFPPPIKLTATI
jgi:hypothetical protein